MAAIAEPNHLKPAHWVGFLVLCVLWSSAWLVDGAAPSSLPFATRQCLHDAVLAAVLAIPARISPRLSAPSSRRFHRRRVGWRAKPQWPTLALASICLFGIPAMLVDTARTIVSDAMSTALFALVPVVILVLAPHVTSATNTAPMLAPAFVALTGTLLLLPFALPDSYRQAEMEGLILAAVLSAAGASLWLHRLLAGGDIIRAAAICCAANAAFFALFAVVEGHASTDPPLAAWLTESATALLYDLPQIVLLLWLARDVSPARFAARYYVVPLLTIVEGWILLREGASLRAGIGAALAAAGAWRLLTMNDGPEESSLILR